MHTDTFYAHPRALPARPCVAVWTPSSPAPATFPRRFERALAAMADHGYAIRLGRHAVSDDGLMAASPRELADDLHDLLKDVAVDAVVCAVGGYTSMAMLPYLDFDLIAECGKPLIGYSDVTALLWAILHRSSMITFHGPMVVSEWGESGGPWAFTVDHFRRALAPWTGPVELVASSTWTEEMHYWDVEDNRPRTAQPGRWRCLVPGAVDGWLLPGCAPTVSRLFGTPFMPDVSGAVLCLEAVEMSPEGFYGLLLQWQVSGYLDRIAGLVIGRHCRPRLGGRGSEAFDRAILQSLGDRHIPVLVDADFGHTEPRLTLPVGGACRLDSEAEKLILTAPAVWGEAI